MSTWPFHITLLIDWLLHKAKPLSKDKWLHMPVQHTRTHRLSSLGFEHGSKVHRARLCVWWQIQYRSTRKHWRSLLKGVSTKSKRCFCRRDAQLIVCFLVNFKYSTPTVDKIRSCQYFLLVWLFFMVWVKTTTPSVWGTKVNSCQRTDKTVIF